MGKSAKQENLLQSKEDLSLEGFEVHNINRGGDITYHGPGQVTGYYIMNLERLYRDVHRYVRNLEEIIIRTIAEYEVEGLRLQDYTGVWVQHGSKLKKICAIGVHLSRWVSMHGFGFNVNSDLSHFNRIIPCGINDDDKEVTSLEALKGHKIEITEIEQKILKHSQEVFDLTYVKT